MKAVFSLVAVLAALAPAAAQTIELEELEKGIEEVFEGLKPFFDEVECISPCLINAAEQTECGNRNPLAALCNSINDIADEADSCIRECGMDTASISSLVSLFERICA